ncbi:hypothetical protein [Streptomyces sp. NPDC090022]|uniref:caspase, EACC1-associated type n=1 Tax=Streptomyces sp. NPDC090022 TaxID=3365920 RepID=UPI00382345C2
MSAQDQPAAASGTGLASPGARAVLVGTGGHAPGSTLPALPSVATTLDDLGRVLHEVCGMPEAAIRRVPSEAGAAMVLAAVEEAVAQATGVVLFVYVGHGLLGPGDELYLATHGCPAPDRVASAVPYRTVRDLLGGARAGSAVLLDCCFSGRATVAAGARTGDPFVSAGPRGSFLLASASYFSLSFAPVGERHTLFGGRLLRVLEEGDPTGPPLLTLDGLHTCLDRAAGDDAGRPHRQSDGTLSRLVVAPNRAYRPGAVPGGEPPADVPCPYPGMGPFRPQDSDWFFGREEPTRRLLRLVRDPAGRTRPVILVGASGAGKSSLLRAGLLAHAAHGHTDDHEGEPAKEGGGEEGTWPALLLPAPGPHPMRALARLWSQATGREEAEVARELGEGLFPSPLPGRPACRLLVIDQFEEVFTRCEDTAEQAALIRLLCAQDLERRAGQASRPRIVLAVRADHYGNCLGHPGLRAALDARGPLNLPPLSRGELRAVIERPAARAGLVLQDGLADRVLEDLSRSAAVGPGEREHGETALPFLAHALHETFRNRSGAVLTLAGYEATGGIWRSVTTTFGQLYDGLDEAGRRAARDLLLRMVHLTADGEAVPRPVVMAELLAGRDPRDQERFRLVCDRLAAARLVIVDHDRVRIAHEALLRACSLLRSWILEARAELIAHQQLADAAAQWEQHGRSAHYLFTGARLAALRPAPEGRAEPPPAGTTTGIAFTALESDFVRACVRLDRRIRMRRALITSAVVALALLLTVAGTVAFQQGARARERAAELASQRIAAQADALRAEDPAAALDMSLAAYRRASTAEARASLVRAAMTPVPVSLPGHQDKVVSLAYRPDGTALASVSRDDTLRLWDTRDPYRPVPSAVLRTGRGGAVWGPGGRHLAVVTAEGLSVWSVEDVHAPRLIARQETDVGRIHPPAGSRDGRTMAVPVDRGRVLLWDLTDPAAPALTTLQVSGRGHHAITAAFHPDGRTLAVAVTDDTAVAPKGDSLQLWDIAAPGGPRPRGRLDDQTLLSTAFHPDGTLLAAGSITGGVRLFDTSDPDRFKEVTGSLPTRAPVHPQLAYSPDGGHLAASSVDGRARLLRQDRKPDALGAGVPLPGSGTLLALVYRPDGRGIASGGSDGTIHLWHPPARTLPERIGVSRRGPANAFADHGRLLATDTDTAGAVWRLPETGRPRKVATLPPPWIVPRFLPGRDALLTQDGTRTRIALWNLADGTLRAGAVFTVGGRPAVSRDGRVLAVQDRAKGPLVLWDITDLESPRRLAEVPAGEDPGMTPAFVRADTLALMSEKSTQLWDVSDPLRPRRGAEVRGTPSSVFPAERADDQAVLVTAPDSTRRDPFAPPRFAARPLHGPGTAPPPPATPTATPAPTSAAAAGAGAAAAGAGATGAATDITGDPLHLAMASRRVLATLSESGEPALWALGGRPGKAPLQGSLSKLDGLTGHGRAGLIAAWDNEAGGRDLAVWRITDTPPHGPVDSRLVYHVSALTDGILGFSVAQFDPTGTTLALYTGTDLLEGLGARTAFLPIDPGRLARSLCATRSGPVSRVTWRTAFPDLPYTDPCP